MRRIRRNMNKQIATDKVHSRRSETSVVWSEAYHQCDFHKYNSISRVIAHYTTVRVGVMRITHSGDRITALCEAREEYRVFTPFPSIHEWSGTIWPNYFVTPNDELNSRYTGTPASTMAQYRHALWAEIMAEFHYIVINDEWQILKISTRRSLSLSRGEIVPILTSNLVLLHRRKQ